MYKKFFESKDKKCPFEMKMVVDEKDCSLLVDGVSKHGKVDFAFEWRGTTEDDIEGLWKMGAFFRKSTKYGFLQLLKYSDAEAVISEEDVEERPLDGTASCCFNSELKKVNNNLVYEVELISVGSYGSAKFNFGVVDDEKLKLIRKTVHMVDNNLLSLCFPVKKYFLNSGAGFDDLEEE